MSKTKTKTPSTFVTLLKQPFVNTQYSKAKKRPATGVNTTTTAMDNSEFDARSPYSGSGLLVVFWLWLLAFGPGAQWQWQWVYYR
jgi:hypothetical protein